MDLPGFGLTGPNPKRTYDASSYNAFLHSFLKALKVDSPIVAGNSLGGFIAWKYAAGHPAVKALVLLDPAGFPLGSQNSNLGFRIARIPVLNQLLKYITPKSIVRKSAEQSYGNKRLVNDALVDRYHALTKREGNRQALIDRLSKEADVDTSLLDKIQMPTLIIWGDLDQVVPFSHLDNFKRHLHHASIATYQGVGHVPMEEAPDSVAVTLRKWMPLATGSKQ
jgi:pimeloyl-ACP methyl ester carboxylesterase